MEATMMAPCIDAYDILVNIFLRLSTDSLVRLRWACKYWFNLISRDHEFIKMHFHRSTHDKIIKNNPCVLIKDDDGNLFKRYFNYTTYNASPKVELDLPFKCIGNGFTIVSSCNGLILFQSNSTLDGIVLGIWNPCTNEHRVLPEPLKSFREKLSYGYGFGYDRTIDDYKVIRNAYCCRYEDGVETDIVQVYTLRANSWRILNESIPNYIGCLSDVGVFVNGALYWIIFKRFFSFDIEKEKYHEISTGGMDLFNRKLVAFEGCLCLLPTPSTYGGVMYVMNKNNYSWMKVCTLTGVMTVAMTKPLRFTENGNILMVGRRLPDPFGSWSSQSDLILLNTKGRKSTNLNICHKSYVQEVYIESLVSLASDQTSKENEEDDVNTKRRKGNTDVCIV